jgi:hypothetical protein
LGDIQFRNEKTGKKKKKKGLEKTGCDLLKNKTFFQLFFLMMKKSA